MKAEKDAPQAEKDAKAKQAKEGSANSGKRDRATSKHESSSPAGSDAEGKAKRAKTAKSRKQESPAPSPHEKLASKRPQMEAVRLKQEADGEVRRLRKLQKMSSLPEGDEEGAGGVNASGKEPAKPLWEPEDLEEAARTTTRAILCAAHANAHCMQHYAVRTSMQRRR